MNMIRKGQLHGVVKGDVGGQVALLTKLFGVAVEIEQAGSLPPHFVFFQFFATQALCPADIQEDENSYLRENLLGYLVAFCLKIAGLSHCRHRTG